MPTDNPQIKTCLLCNQEKPLAEFAKHPECTDGYVNQCKTCLRKKRRQHQAAHIEEVRARWREEQRHISEASRARKKAYASLYRAEHKDVLNAYTCQWRKEHPERCRELGKSWKRAHPEKAREMASNNNRRRAARWAKVKVERINAFAIAERDHWRCHICKKHVSRKDMTLDHLIPISHGGPHTEWNVALAHFSCNSRRGPGRIPAQLRLPFSSG